MEKRQQIGLWIDGGLLASSLTVYEKVVLADILVLSKGSNSFVKTNDTIASTFNISSRTIRRVIRSLKDKGLIKYILTRPYGNVKTKRVIYPCYNKIKELIKEDKCTKC